MSNSPASEDQQLTALDMPAEGIPEVIDTPAALRRAVRALQAGTGPLAVDTERASGFRYGQRAFLIQIRRPGAGTWLIDPAALDDLSILAEFANDQTWILHAATQDLPCLHELGLSPAGLLDTELAGRLAGFPRVALGTMTANLLDIALAKEHSAVDWSTRPLPDSWLAYAALDVEVLHELWQAIEKVLIEQGKLDFALQEFEYTRNLPDPEPAAEPWRKLSGINQLKGRKQLAVARELPSSREALARSRDVAPGRLLPDRAIIAAIMHKASTVPELLKIPGFHTRHAKRVAPRWLAAIQRGRSTRDLPELRGAKTGLPHPRSWVEKNPPAAARLDAAKASMEDLVQQWNIPLENLLAPKALRQLCWQPPKALDEASIAGALQAAGARDWQVQLASGPLAGALGKK